MPPHGEVNSPLRRQIDPPHARPSLPFFGLQDCRAGSERGLEAAFDNPSQNNLYRPDTGWRRREASESKESR